MSGSGRTSPRSSGGENQFDFDVLGEGGKTSTIDFSKPGKRKKG